MQRQPGWAPAQEEACQGPQWLEPGALQEQSPPPPAAFRPREQPPAGPHKWKEEEKTQE